jgi:DNA-binding Xre family transcriptional regulator
VKHPPPAPCPRCGGEKSPGQGRRYCDDCREIAEWKAERKRKLRKGRAPCVRCHGIKGPGQGRRLCPACKAKAGRARTPRTCPCGVVIEVPDRLCAACRAASQERKRLKRRDEQRERRRVAREQGKREQRKRRKAAERENARIRYRLLAEREGRTLRRAPEVVQITPKRTEVPTAPLVWFLRERLIDTDVEALGEAARIRPYVLSRIVSGDVQRIRLAQADRICVALGLHYDLVYVDVA